jgi:predicted phosphate transport protein (TIGR00153 family)
MKLRIFPREESYFDLFDEVTANLADAAKYLLDMVEDFVDPEMKAKRLVEAEHEGDRLTYAIYSRLNTTFITPFDREDIHALAGQLDDVLDAIEEAADLLVLHKVTEPLEAVIEQVRLLDRAARATAVGIGNLRGLKQEPLGTYLININELENEGDRLYRRARADLYNFDAEHPARYVLMWKDIIEQLEEALDGFEHVAHTVETVIIKHA